MRKFLKADEIKVLSALVAQDKEDYEQLVVSVAKSGVETGATITVTHADAVGGTYVAFEAIPVVFGDADSAQVEFNIVGAKQFFTVASDGAGAVVAILGDKRLIRDVLSKDLPEGTPRPLLNKDFYNI